MTQFLAYSAISDLGGERLEVDAVPALSRRDGGNWFTVVGGLQGSFDELVLDAQRVLADGGCLTDTALHEALAPIIAGASRVVLWYASDFDDLEQVSSADAFWSVLERSIREPQAEAYIDFRITS